MFIASYRAFVSGPRSRSPFVCSNAKRSPASVTRGLVPSGAKLRPAAEAGVARPPEGARCPAGSHSTNTEPPGASRSERSRQAPAVLRAVSSSSRSPKRRLCSSTSGRCFLISMIEATVITNITANIGQSPKIR